MSLVLIFSFIEIDVLFHLKKNYQEGQLMKKNQPPLANMLDLLDSHYFEIYL